MNEWLAAGKDTQRADGCHAPVVYIEACCHHREKAIPEPVVKAERNGHSPVEAVTQLLPQVNGARMAAGKAPVKDEEAARHRNDRGGLDMHDLTLGALIGAGLAIFLVGLLMVLLFR